MMKTNLYCIRHGLALHNVLFYNIGTDSYTKYRDTRLLEKGIEQATVLGETWKNINDIELVVVSPLSRTLSTAYHIFKNKNIHIIAKDFLIEYPIGGKDIVNKREDISNLRKIFPSVDFSLIKNDKALWPDKNESIDDLEKRISLMKQWLSKRPEKNIAIVGHSSFIGQFKDKKIGDEEHELKHCFPYKVILSN